MIPEENIKPFIDNLNKVSDRSGIPLPLLIAVGRQEPGPADWKAFITEAKRLSDLKAQYKLTESVDILAKAGDKAYVDTIQNRVELYHANRREFASDLAKLYYVLEGKPEPEPAAAPGPGVGPPPPAEPPTVQPVPEVEAEGRKPWWQRGLETVTEAQLARAEAQVALGKKALEYDPLTGMKVFGQGLLMLPKQTAAKVAMSLQGYRGATVVDRGVGDRLIASADKDLEAFSEKMAELHKGKKFLPGISIQDVAELPANIAYSGTVLAAGLPVGAAVSAIPVVGPPLGVAAGMAVGGTVAFNMASYEIMQEYLEAKNDEAMESRGTGLTKAEEKKLKSEFNSDAIKYGLWEAIPEAIGTAAGVGIALAPLKRFVSAPLAARIMAKVGAMYAGELATETVTQMGQERVRAGAGLPGAEMLDWTKLPDWLKALRQVAPQTFLLTTVLGGAGAGAVEVKRALKGAMAEARLAPVIEMLKKEVAEKTPQRDFFEEMLSRDPETIAEEIAPALEEPTVEEVPAEGVVPGGRPAEEMPIAIEELEEAVTPEVPPPVSELPEMAVPVAAEPRGVIEKPTWGVSISPQHNVSEMIKQYGDFAVVVKDTNGNRAQMNASQFQKLKDNPLFMDRVHSVWVRKRPAPVAEPVLQEGFMEALNIDQALAIPEEAKAPYVLLELPGITLVNNSTVTAVQQQKFVDMIMDNEIRQLLLDRKVSSVAIEPPYKFSRSEEANLDPKTRAIAVNADAEDPKASILHELAHQAFLDWPQEAQERAVNIVKSLDVSQYPSAKGYVELGEHEEAVAELLYRHPDLFADIAPAAAPTQLPAEQLAAEIGRSVDFVNAYRQRGASDEEIRGLVRPEVERVAPPAVPEVPPVAEVAPPVPEVPAEMPARSDRDMSLIRDFTDFLQNAVAVQRQLGPEEQNWLSNPLPETVPRWFQQQHGALWEGVEVGAPTFQMGYKSPPGTLANVMQEGPVAPAAKDPKALSALGYTESQIGRMTPEVAAQVVDEGTAAEGVSVLRDGSVVKPQKPPARDEEEIAKSEPEFIDDSPPVGSGIKKTIPPEISVEKPPRDLTGWRSFMTRWWAPTRLITETIAKNPIANRIAHIARDTESGMTNEVNEASARVHDIFKGLNSKETEQLIDLREAGTPIDQVPEKLRPAYEQVNDFVNEFYEMIRDDMNIAVEKWGMSPEEYWPHIFVGEYEIVYQSGTDKKGRPTWKHIEAGFARSLGEAVDKAMGYLGQNPDADIKVRPRGFSNDYSATLLSRKGFFRFIGEVKKATELDKDEIMSMMRGVAAIKPRGKFVGNFLQRTTNLGGYMKDENALKIYAARVLRKKWLDPFRKQATELAAALPPGLRQYFLELIDDVSGKFDPYDNRFKVSRGMARVTRGQSVLKLGYRPITAFLNRLQPLQLAFPEIGHYLFRGNIFKRTAAGRAIVDESGVHGQVPKYVAGEGMYRAKPKEKWYHPLGWFTRAEMANREDVIAGGYLFAKKVFKMDKARANRMGYKYILDYLDQYPDEHQAALEYAKQLNVETNFYYGNADLPKMFRTQAGRVLFQFRTYPINFVSTTLQWTLQKPNNPHYWARLSRLVAMNTLLGGVRSVPYLGRHLWKVLFLSPLAIPLVGEENRDRAKEVLLRGVFSLMGIDMSRRLGPNEFMPRSLRDALGPAAGDAYNLYRFAIDDWDWKQLLRATPMIRDLYTAVAGGEYIIDPNSRMRMVAKATGWEKALEAIGAPIVKEEVNRDLRAISAVMRRRYRRDKARYIDRMIGRITGGTGEKLRELLGIEDKSKRADEFWDAVADDFIDAFENGVYMTEKDIELEWAMKELEPLFRDYRTFPKPKRQDLLELIDKADKLYDLFAEPEKRK